MQQRLLFSPINGKAEQAVALAWLGEVFVRRSMWRPAIDAYRASLDRADIAQVRNIYEDLREKHGFRILNYKVDNESASPRVCFQLSEPLAQAR
jgi:alpha-2-macroglobulin